MSALLLAVFLATLAEDRDRDGDGLSDFHEVHKYGTDPAQADSDGDGTPDGDWLERREYAYTVHAVVQVVGPVTEDVLGDDFQDARLLCRTPTYTELEVVLYPFSTVAETLEADPRWRKTVRGMEEWTRPGPTSNWDAGMRAALIAELEGQGIDPDALDDRELVERASQWCLDRTEFTDSFTTFFSQWDGTRMRVHPELEEWLLAQNQGRSLEEEWQRELYARGMFENRVRGSCTSSAIYLNGCLRALGIPARIVYAIPIVDASDEREMEMVRRLRHPGVRGTILHALEPLRESWSSHTFNEVFVGGRWRRLNYQHLGQGILDRNLFGLIVHVATFSDWADGDVASSIGLRQRAGKDAPDGFGGPNPYSTVSLSDHFGEHCAMDPEALPELPEVTTLTVERVGWYFAADRDPSVSMTLDDAREAGHVLVQVEEFLPGEGAAQYAAVYARCGKQFRLTARGLPDVPLHAARGYWVSGSTNAFYLRIEPQDFPGMKTGVAYTLQGPEDPPAAGFFVQPGLTLVRETEYGPPGAPSVPRGLAVDRAVWGDSPEFPAAFGLSRTALLLHVESDPEFPVFKRFTELVDRTFLLEAEGQPPVEVTAGTGGVTTAAGTFALVHLSDAQRASLAEGVEYRIRPRNEHPLYVWEVGEEVAVVP